MAGLVLNLRPNEKFIVNGAVLQNGAKRAQIRVDDENASVLRVRDAIHPDDVDTPVKRAYYTAQLIVSGDVPANEGRVALDKALGELLAVFRIGPAARHLGQAAEASAEGRFYSVLCQLKHVMPLERALLDFARDRDAGDEAADGGRQVA